MRKILTSTFMALVLAGCGYEHNEIISAKANCDDKGGIVKFYSSYSGSIVHARCEIDGISYRIGRSSSVLYDAIPVSKMNQ